MQNFYKNRLNCAKRALEAQKRIEQNNPSVNNTKYLSFLQKKADLLSAVVDIIDVKSDEDMCMVFNLLASDLHEIISTYFKIMLESISNNTDIRSIKEASDTLRESVDIDGETVKALKNYVTKEMLHKYTTMQNTADKQKNDKDSFRKNYRHLAYATPYGQEIDAPEYDIHNGHKENDTTAYHMEVDI